MNYWLHDCSKIINRKRTLLQRWIVRQEVSTKKCMVYGFVLIKFGDLWLLITSSLLSLIQCKARLHFNQPFSIIKVTFHFIQATNFGRLFFKKAWLKLWEDTQNCSNFQSVNFVVFSQGQTICLILLTKIFPKTKTSYDKSARMIRKTL